MLDPVGLSRWFAVVGFKADDALWGLSIQRSLRQGPFEAEETAALARFAARLTAPQPCRRPSADRC